MNTKALLLLALIAVLAVGFYPRPPVDPSPIAELKTMPPASVARSATAPEFVPSRERPEFDCEIVTRYLPAGDGTVIETLACESQDEKARHPYEDYPDEALESLSYSDADAAEILGMRLRELDEVRAMSLMLRASALSGGNTAPVIRYSNAYPQPVSIDGVLVRRTVHTKYVLSAVADLLDGSTQFAAYWEDQIRQVSTEPQKEIDTLQQRAVEIVNEMRKTELDVKGHSTIGGRDDA